ncbi:Inner membrane ABC transporter permease protein YejE [Sinobacterium norvegicum]|uniref:Inner membrane ABC transporter permease protein YejE n=1 Tax=Sinobacterium norvegicum TaxID=1641715 RepID=A0ABN8ECS4_9GAMM|nr:ABC transporter permease [Sinobacterium norvegicum]CAH0990275.1 Inner membrane ABC transporter permease protein YejE [Sinobacterium norvegicum]
MSMFTLSPQGKRQWQRFKAIKRGYYSAVLLVGLLLLSCFAELLISNRALVVNYQGEFYFPTYGAVIDGQNFGQQRAFETDYRDLKQTLKDSGEGWVIMPPVPYSPTEIDLNLTDFPPYPPSLQHWLGTDTSGRDVLARLVYGFRTAMAFSLILLICNYIIGVSIGCLMGFLGGKVDLFGQRIIEIWSNVPFLYVIMIIASIIVPSFWTLVVLMVLFGWMGITWYMRTVTYREASREYVMAARAIGASQSRILFRHILPNTISLLVTFIPFSIAAGISSLTALDYLGFGLPKTTPSWGDLLAQGTNNLQYEWIVLSVIVAMTVVLTMVTFIGEAIREAFDPKKYAYFK